MSWAALHTGFSERKNQVASIPQVSSLLSRFFSSDILPPRQTKRFNHDDIPGNCYISLRSCSDSISVTCDSSKTQKETRFIYERQLDELFWGDYSKKLFILGEIGSGKSTLINYYLRCFCPNNGQKKQDFTKKLIIYFDAIDYPHVAESADNFYHFVKGEIETAFLEIGIDIEDYIKKRSLHAFNIREWVRYALEEISQITRKSIPEIPFKYLVFVLDNLDQCTLEVQKNILAITEGWSKLRNINIWRVIIPMWPYTREKLRLSDFKPARGGTEITIGPIHTEGMFETRHHALKGELEKLKFPPIQIGAARDFFDTLHTAAVGIFYSKVARLCGSNLRKKLLLWGNFVTGDRAQNLYREITAVPHTRRTYHYEILDAIICGYNDVFNSDPHKILNIFNILGFRKADSDILIGLHAIWLLHLGTNDQIDFHFKLLSLGYSKEKIVTVEKRLVIAAFFYEIPTGSGHNQVISYKLCEDVIEAYQALIFEPAYLDNVAIVTPVDSVTLKNIKVTRGDRFDQFFSRVTTTLSFLVHLKACEDRFVSGDNILDPDLRQIHSKKLREMGIPVFVTGLARSYFERLSGLQRSGLLPHVSDNEWKEMFSLLAPFKLDAVDTGNVLFSGKE